MNGGADVFEVDCLDTYDNHIEYLTQWDINQKLKIVLTGCDEGYLGIAPEIHFANAKSQEALVVRSAVQGNDTIIADIPNILLQDHYPLLVYVYLSDNNDAYAQKTIIKLEIPIRKRVRPSEYDYVENIEHITAEQIKREIKQEIADELCSGTLVLDGFTLRDGTTGILHRIRVDNGKMIIENLGQTG